MPIQNLIETGQSALTTAQRLWRHMAKWGDNHLGKELTFLKGYLIRLMLNQHLKRGTGRYASLQHSTRKPQQQFDPQQQDWDQFVGSKYLQLFLQFGLDYKGVIVEIGPGSVSKVGHGLQQYRFRGTVVVVEPEPSALAAIVGDYQELIPRATIVGVNSTLEDFLLVAQQQYPVIDMAVANHVLDDMIIGKFIVGLASRDKTLEFFENHYEEELLVNTGRC